MKSRASIKSHPIHPILISFPIAFFIGALVFDLLFLTAGKEGFRTTGYHLVIAGIAGAMLAAVPGFIDYRYTVPPDSSAKKRAAKHGLLNTTNLLLFILVFFLKNSESALWTWIVVLEIVGISIMMAAGWMGGTLVYRNQIGVDQRYADAGKWKETYLPGEKSPVKVAAVEELKKDQMKLVHVAGKRIVIGRTEDGFVAFSDHCTHKGGSLAGGAMMCGTVYCPWHGSQFSVYDGSVKAGPANEKIATYRVEEKDGNVYLHF